MIGILSNKQKWNKRGVELTINFIVTLILALAAFALGAVIIKTLTSGGVDSITMTQDELNQRISQLSCSSRDKICISNNNKAVNGGDLVITGLAVFNSLSGPVTLDITVTPKRAYKPDGTPMNENTDFGPPTSIFTPDAKYPSALNSGATLTIAQKTQGQLAIGIVTKKETPKGTYLFKVGVTDSTSSSTLGFTAISDEISITVK